MSLQISIFIVCVFLAQMADGTGVQFVMERHPDNYFCGHLQCLADFTHTDHDVSTFVEMAIYDITRVNSELRLASVSTFDPDLYVDTTKNSAVGCTGTISRLKANLTLQLRHDIDCLYAVYKCQLHLVTVSGHSQVITEIVTPEYNHSYSRIGQSKTDWILRNVSLIADKLNQRDKHWQHTFKEFKEVSEISDRLDKRDKLCQDKFTELKQEVSLISGTLKERDKLWQDKFTELKQEVDSLPKNVFDIIRDWTLGQPLGYLCYRGMPHKKAREKFLLSGKVLALCDTETDGGGWVIIQRRVRGDVDFYRGWDDYKTGFGRPHTDFWIGNDIIHDLTSQGYNELRIDFAYNGTNYFAQYTNFRVADESSNYRIAISGFSGYVHDSMAYHNGQSFSTLDRDNDLRNLSCSVTFHGAWWYNSCFEANLNGAWAKTDNTGIAWSINGISDHTWKPLTFTEMKIR